MESDIKEIKSDIKELKNRPLSVGRTGLYLMVFFTWLNTCGLDSKLDGLEENISNTRSSLSEQIQSKNLECVCPEYNFEDICQEKDGYNSPDKSYLDN